MNHPSNLRIAILQRSLCWERPNDNRLAFSTMMAGLKGACNLVLLPEMFTTGFTMNADRFAEPMIHETYLWMRREAAQGHFALGGSLIVEEGGKYYNRFVLVAPDGSIQHYDKRHLFRMGGEHEHFARGSSRVVFSYMGWRILPQVCYDLRFPVWSRCRNDYDMVVYVANFPAVRRDVWNILLRARAIENQCYAVGVNCVGCDGNGVLYRGDSQVVGPNGELVGAAAGDEVVLHVEVDYQQLAQYRTDFPALADGDDFRILS